MLESEDDRELEIIQEEEREDAREERHKAKRREEKALRKNKHRWVLFALSRIVYTFT